MKKLLFVISILICMFSASFARAEDLYIAQTAAGGATGANCANALVYTFFNSSGNWGAGTGKISAGDTVHVCGTITGPGTNMNALTFQGSGTAGNIITLHFESGAKFSNPAWPDSAPGAIDLPDNTAYITIEGNSDCGYINHIEVPCTEGIEDTANGYGLANDQPSAAIYGRPVSHVTIKNLYCHNLYVQPYLPLSGGHKHDVGDCFHLGGDNDTIQNVDMHDSFQGAVIDYYVGSTNGEIKNSYGYHLNWGLVGAGHETNAHMNGYKVHDNEIYDWQNWDDEDLGPGGNCCHHNGLFLQEQGPSGTGIDGLQVYNNYFHGDVGTRMTAQLFLDCENMGSYCYPGSLVFNNVFQVNSFVTGSGPSNGNISMGRLAYSVSLYNNTFYSVTNYGANCVNWTGPLVTLKNNTFVNCGLSLFDQTTTLIASDYNNYGTTNTRLCCDASGYTTLGAWQSAAPTQNVHSDNSAPNFNTSTYVPNSGSPLISTAVNLTSLSVTNLNKDYYGVSRPGGSTSWDKGCCQFSSGSGPTADLSPTSIAFGSVVTGTTTSAQTVTLTNNGVGTLTYSSIVKSGANPTFYTLAAGSCVLSGSTLAASSSCTFTVSFSPVTAVAYSATVVVTSDASPTTTTLTLSGTGVAVSAGGETTGGTVTIGGSSVFQ